MKKTKRFNPADRYKYDFTLLDKGYSQIDTDQDAWYYGNWANPDTFVIFTYAEGDCIIVECDDKEEFVEEIRKMVEWNKERQGFCKIDPGLSPKSREKWVNLGLQDILH